MKRPARKEEGNGGPREERSARDQYKVARQRASGAFGPDRQGAATGYESTANPLRAPLLANNYTPYRAQTFIPVLPRAPPYTRRPLRDKPPMDILVITHALVYVHAAFTTFIIAFIIRAADEKHMIPTQIFRLIHTDRLLWQVTNKSLLAKLRKKTGYTFSNCKKALEMHDNDLTKAEIWLQEQAQAHGWTQAAKLEGRSTRQGLIAVMVNENRGALVEINCETDFVARNKRFHGLAETVVASVLNNAPTLDQETLSGRIVFYTDTLKLLQGPDGKSLADHAALTIGSVGENIGIRRALSVTVHPKISLFGCTHPEPVHPVPVSFGRYGALVAFTSKENSNKSLGMQLCQHIIGMNPQRIGNPSTDAPNSNIDNETCMIYQEFLLDPTVSVQQILSNAEANIVDFARFEMGEPLEGEYAPECAETSA